MKTFLSNRIVISFFFVSQNRSELLAKHKLDIIVYGDLDLRFLNSERFLVKITIGLFAAAIPDQ